MPLKHSVEEIILTNGARGLLIHTPDSTAVHYNIEFRAGNDYVRDDSVSQTAHIMEHMTFGPNAQFDTTEAFSRTFSRHGADHNAFTGNIAMTYVADAGHSEWQRILELQLLAITQPTFTQESLDSEKGNVREELMGYGNSHTRILWQEVMRRVGLRRWYDSHELSTIDAVTLADIHEHHQRTHTTDNMRFIFVGNLAEHRQTIEAIMNAVVLPRGQLLDVKKQSAHASGPVCISRKDLPSLRFNLSFFINRSLTRRELRAMSALGDILTGSFLHSRILGQARKRGLCYHIGEGVDSGITGVTEWSLGGQVGVSNAKELFALIGKELRAVSEDGVTNEELQESKDARLGGMQMDVQTVRSLASWYEPEYYDYGRIDHVDAMPGLIEGTTVEEIRSLVKEFLTSEAWSFGGIGDIDEQAFQKHYDALAERLNKR